MQDMTRELIRTAKRDNTLSVSEREVLTRLLHGNVSAP